MHKLSTKTFTATNIKTGNKVEIAIAPHWFKPWSRQWVWFGTYGTYNTRYDAWMSTADRSNMRKRELASAGIYPEMYDFKEKAAEYWNFKRKMTKAEKTANAMLARGVEYVVLRDPKEIKVDGELTVYPLYDFTWCDDQSYGSRKGHITIYEKNIVFHPDEELHAIPMFR